MFEIKDKFRTLKEITDTQQWSLDLLQKDINHIYQKIKAIEKAIQAPNPTIDENGFRYGALFRIAEIKVDPQGEKEKIQVILEPLRDEVEILIRS